MMNHEIIFALLALFSEMLGTLSGFGASTFFLPLAIKLESYHLVLVLTAILHVFGNGYRIFYFYKNVNIKNILTLCIPSVVLSFLGSLINPYISIDLTQKFLGLFLIFFSGYQFFSLKNKIQISFTFSIVLVALSGFLTGLIGTGGALRGVGLMSLNLPYTSFIALSSLIDIGGDFFRLVGYLYNGYMDWSHWYYIPMLAAMAYIGTYSAKKLLGYIKHEIFYKIVLTFVFLNGLFLFF